MAKTSPIFMAVVLGVLIFAAAGDQQPLLEASLFSSKSVVFAINQPWRTLQALKDPALLPPACNSVFFPQGRRKRGLLSKRLKLENPSSLSPPSVS